LPARITLLHVSVSLLISAAKLFRAAADRHEPDLREALLDIRGRERFRDFAVEHGDDVLRRFAGTNTPTH
jgi:hypothetical protein